MTTLYHRRHHYSAHQTPFQFLLLLLLILTVLLAFVRTGGQPDKQLQIGVTAAAAYVIWGVYHHLHKDDLHWKIMVEYCSIALFGIVLLWIVFVLLA